MIRLCLTSFTLFIFAGSGFSTQQSSVSQFGITWTFDQAYECGQYVNGDWWVQGPVTVISVDPPCVTDSGRTMNGSMLNPVPGSAQGYDSEASGYESDLTVGADGASFTVSVDGSVSVKSLVSTISIDQASFTYGEPRLSDAAVLTVVADIPSADAFRPPYCGNTKPDEMTATEIDWTVLKTRAVPPVYNDPGIPSWVPAFSDMERHFERPWIVHMGGPTMSHIMPTNNMLEVYQARQARCSNYTVFLLNMDYTQAVKRNLLYSYLQYGIDVYGVVCSGGKDIWWNNGGTAGGRKLPLVFASVVLDNEGMQSVMAKTGQYRYTSVDSLGVAYWPDRETPGYIHFGFDDQTFYVSQTDVDITNGVHPTISWDPDSRITDPHPYTAADIGMPEWGIRHAGTPGSPTARGAGTSIADWDIPYRTTNGAQTCGQALAARIMGLETLWNHPAMFDYADRYMHYVDGLGKPHEWGIDGVDLIESQRFIWNLWSACRDGYGCIYTGLDTLSHEREYENCTQGIPSAPGRSGTAAMYRGLSVYPNPAGGKSTINLKTSDGTSLPCVIYDRAGSTVISLDTHSTLPVIWNLTDSSGRPVGPGVYYVRYNSNTYRLLITPEE